MIDYSFFKTKIPEIVLNISGKIFLDNKDTIKINFEIDYDSFSVEELDKIKLKQENEFQNKTDCKTYFNEEIIKKVFIPVIENGNKQYLKIKTENNTLNFSMIKKKIDVFKNDNIVYSTEINHSKIIDFSLSDGEYIFKCSVYNINNELIKETDIFVTLKTNYTKLFDTKTQPIIINFTKDEGNFDLILSANSKRLYSFKIADIVSENDNIFEFSYYNSSSNDKKQIGKIGAELNLLNDKQIEEIIKHPEQEVLIKPEFVFDINELFTTQHSKGDIGVIKFPTIRQKIKDTYLPYYNLKCDVTQNYSIDFNKTDDLLVTDKFNNYPLFYKFFIDTPFDKLTIIDKEGNEINDFIVDDISDNVHIVYFNPLRNKEYYYILDNDPPLHIRYKRSIESYKMIFDKELEFYKNKLTFENPIYFGDLMLKGNGTYEVEIQFSDYTRKTFQLKAVDKEFKFLEDERVKINNKIISLEIKTKDKVIAISMICNFKNNRTNYSYFKSNFKDFVYIAQPVDEININEIPENELSKFNINDKYIFKNGVIEAVPNGPLYLEEIKKQDIIFTDIEEWLKEHSIGETEIIKTTPKDKFFLESVVNPVRVIKYEDK